MLHLQAHDGGGLGPHTAYPASATKKPLKIFRVFSEGGAKRVNNLTQSILAKAFRGELNERWRKDSPDLNRGVNSAAVVLLERIKAERHARRNLHDLSVVRLPQR